MEGLAFPPLPAIPGNNPEWEYDMRRSMQEIVPGVYLGPYSAATKKRFDYLRQHGITHIICIRHPLEANLIKPNFPNNFKYLVLDIVDTPSDSIIASFPTVKEFIDNCLAQGGKALLHGNAGISRSATLMIAYLMETFGQTYKDAFLYVQQRRFCISPNEGFVRQLLEYEPIYLARFQAKNQQFQNSGGVKRGFESDEDMPDKKTC